MKALNIYTTPYHSEINSLMRGTYLVNQKTKKNLQDVIIHSIMCGSALSKIPESHIKTAYRKEAIFDQKIHQRRINAAKNKNVVSLGSFVSASSSLKDFRPDDNNLNTVFVFSNLKGKDIRDFSVCPEENEFLIPPTQVQILKYNYHKGCHYFNTTLVSDLEKVEQEALRFDPEKIKQLEMELNTENYIKEKITHYLTSEITKLQPSFWSSLWFDQKKTSLKLGKFEDCLQDLSTVNLHSDSFMKLMTKIEGAAQIHRSRYNFFKPQDTSSAVCFKPFQEVFSKILSQPQNEDFEDESMLPGHN